MLSNCPFKRFSAKGTFMNFFVSTTGSDFFSKILTTNFDFSMFADFGLIDVFITFSTIGTASSTTLLLFTSSGLSFRVLTGFFGIFETAAD